MFALFIFATFFYFSYSSPLSQNPPGSDLIILDQVLINTNTIFDSADKSNFKIKFEKIGKFLVTSNSILQISNAIFMFENDLQPTEFFKGESNSSFIFKVLTLFFLKKLK